MFSFLYHFQRLIPELDVYMSNTAGVLSEIGTAYPPRTLEFSPVFCLWNLCCYFCIFLRWSIMCFNVLSSVLWCPLRFPHKKKRFSVSIYVICVCLRVVVSNLYSVVFLLFCALCCQFLSIVNFWSSLWYPLTFIYKCQVLPIKIV
jgi:hypothetical protein